MLTWACQNRYTALKLPIPRQCVLTKKIELLGFFFVSFKICWRQLFPVRVKINKRNSSVVATEPGSIRAKWAVNALFYGALSRLNEDTAPGVRVLGKRKAIVWKVFSFCTRCILLREMHPLSFTWRCYSREMLWKLSLLQDHLWSLDLT